MTGASSTSGIAAVLDLLECPRCRGRFTIDLGVVRCSTGHSFDLARQGYLNLYARPAPRNADTPAMVAARERFLAAGHYRAVEEALAQAAEASRNGAAVLDCGAGNGHYLSRVLDAVSESRGIALDVSVAAARRAARAHPRLGAVVADAWERLPVGDGRVDLLLNVFAPRNAPEFARVLTPTGTLVTVHPTKRHLAGLRAELGLLDVQPAKTERLAAALGKHFVVARKHLVEYDARWTAHVVRDVVAMGPNAFHVELDRLADRGGGPRPVTVSVEVTTWRARR